MYNSQNLPLSPRKVIKKFLASQFRFLPTIIFIFFFSMPFTLAFYSFSHQAISTQNLNNPIPLGPSFWVFLPLLIAVGVGIFVLLEFLILLYHYLYYRFYYYNFEENKAEIRKGVIQIATGMVRYERLQNIYVDQDILDRVFGLYDVHYETAGESSNFYSHVDGLNKENADKLVAFLTGRLDELEGKPNQSSQESAIDQPVESTTVSAVHLTRADYPLSPKLIWSMTIAGFLSSPFIALFFFLFLSVLFHSLIFNPYAFVVIFVVVNLLLYIYNLIWIKNFSFTFDADKGEIITQVLNRSVSYIYYNRVQNININQGIIDRFFGLSTLSIETAGQGFSMGQGNQKSLRMPTSIPGLSVSDAEKLKIFLLERSQKVKNNL